MDLKNKTIIITGSGQGIGRSIAIHLARAGANIALLDVNPKSLDEVVASCRAEGVSARRYLASVCDEEQVEAAMDSIVSEFGQLDGLVNNAGIIKDASLVQVRNGEVVGRMSVDQWKAVVDVNMTGVFLCGRAAAERMIRLKSGGVIVNISSISRAGNAGQTNYSAAKAGVAAMSVVWAKELAKYGIRAATVAPGFIRTHMLSAMHPEMLEKVVRPVPLKRLGEAEEIAASVRFIFENDFLTGRCIEVDGGLRL